MKCATSAAPAWRRNFADPALAVTDAVMDAVTVATGAVRITCVVVVTEVEYVLMSVLYSISMGIKKQHVRAELTLWV